MEPERIRILWVLQLGCSLLPLILEAWVLWWDPASSYILMAEPDHLFIRPMPNLASETMPVAFPFFYIAPQENEDILRKFYPRDKGPITNIDPIGNSPVVIQKVDCSVFHLLGTFVPFFLTHCILHCEDLSPNCVSCSCNHRKQGLSWKCLTFN
jgi:hypothetical protein